MSIRRDSTTHLIGLLLGSEDDWPRAFEQLTRRLGPVPHRGAEHRIETQRLRIGPFELRDPVRPDVIIDRLARGNHHPREWLKKTALVNDTYLLNNPFTFQAMDSHSAYCAMMRLGFDIPGTAPAARRHPIEGDTRAQAAESESEELAAVSEFDSFARSLTIGPETQIMKFRPDVPPPERYEVAHSFLPAEAGMEILTLSRTINAFFRWEFNSCEAVVTGTRVRPVNYADACPDIAITSLHYYFPWAITQLISWSVFCAVTRRVPQVDTSTRVWFDIADDEELSFRDRLGRYALLADQYFQADEYREFCSTALATLPDLVRDWVDSADFDALLVDTVCRTCPVGERDRFIGHVRGLIALWLADQA